MIKKNLLDLVKKVPGHHFQPILSLVQSHLYLNLNF